MIDLTKLDPANFQSPIVRGAKQLTPAQFKRRMDAALARLITPTEQTQLQLANPDLYAQVGQALLAVQAQAEANNAFNGQLVAYRAAVARLARYRLADGREEQVEEVETGDFDPETGDPLAKQVVVGAAIEPLPATVSQPIFDPETGEPSGEQEIPNPAIEQDDAERAEAQAVVDDTPQEVKDFEAA